MADECACTKHYGSRELKAINDGLKILKNLNLKGERIASGKSITKAFVPSAYGRFGAASACDFEAQPPTVFGLRWK
jgi:hypothetical protein